MLQITVFQLVSNYKAEFEASESCRRGLRELWGGDGESLKKFWCFYSVHWVIMNKNSA